MDNWLLSAACADATSPFSALRRGLHIEVSVEGNPCYKFQVCLYQARCEAAVTNCVSSLPVLLKATA